MARSTDIWPLHVKQLAKSKLKKRKEGRETPAGKKERENIDLLQASTFQQGKTLALFLPPGIVLGIQCSLNFCADCGNVTVGRNAGKDTQAH